MMFSDRVKIRVRGGDGGKGCSSFRREKGRPKMGPDGGDGGNGGDVVLEVSAGQSSLTPLRYMNHYEGGNGQHGMGSDRHGRGGDEVLILVPPGTVVWDLGGGTPPHYPEREEYRAPGDANLPREEEDDEDLDFEDLDDADPDAGPFEGDEHEPVMLADLVHPGQRFIIARGGKGGRGNMHFMSSVNRAPRRADPGQIGEERYLRLELKTVADAGLVGYPNAGKSTLLTAISNARPEVASYPFTTLSPHVGIVEYPDYHRVSVADIPGLIEGASENVGLGHDFLRHIERTKVLIYVLDTAGIDGRLPWDDFKSLQHELECYQPGLTDRPSIILANKMDEPAAVENLKKLRTYTSLPIYPICAVLGEDLKEFLDVLRVRVHHA